MRRLKKLIKSTSEINWATIDVSQDNVEDKFSEVWVDIRTVLDSIINLRITGKKTDRRLGKVVALGDLIYEGETDKFPEFIASMRKVWASLKSWIELIIDVISVMSRFPRINSERVAITKSVLNRIVDIGDWMIHEPDTQ